MSTSSLIVRANKGPAIHGVEGKLTDALCETLNRTEVSGIEGGQSVVIEVADADTCPSAYRLNVLSRDWETGEQLGLGNVSRDWDEAPAQVHWQEVWFYFEADNQRGQSAGPKDIAPAACQEESAPTEATLTD